MFKHTQCAKVAEPFKQSISYIQIFNR